MRDGVVWVSVWLVGWLGVLLIWSTLAHAEYYVCGDAGKFDQAFYRDPSKNRPSNCSLVADNNITSQQSIIASVGTRTDYLKVPSGLVMVKSQAEKDAVDLALANEAAQAQSLKDELNNSAGCNSADLAQVSSRLDTRKAAVYAQIDAMPGGSPPTKATLQAALKQVEDEIDAASRYSLRCFTALFRLVSPMN